MGDPARWWVAPLMIYVTLSHILGQYGNLEMEVRSGVKGQDLGKLSRLGGTGRDPHLSTPGLPLAFVLKANLKVGLLREGSKSFPTETCHSRVLRGVTPFQISPSEPDQRFPQPRQKEKGD